MRIEGLIINEIKKTLNRLRYYREIVFKEI